MVPGNINLNIGNHEALVLFELLADFHDQTAIQVHDNAERLSLVRLHAALEKALVEPFSKDYNKSMNEARALLTQQWGG